ncbi:MAG: TetR family transcriptional regulator C-terminal domain-containing protein [Anaerolineales bacterium]|nr:TetR family transcriptional regulator C-terminal domain-containing protein [Anaerolineales bacterium]
MNTKDNLRTLKTQDKIKIILLDKLCGKPINQITVKEICREAKINRTTFYTHYDNIYDLMQNINVEMQQGIRKLAVDPNSGIFRPLTEKGLEQLIIYIHEQAHFYRILLNDFNGLNIIDRELAAQWENEIEPAMRKKTDTIKNELRYRFEYFNWGFRGIIRKWLNTNCPESPEELTQLIKNFVQL